MSVPQDPASLATTIALASGAPAIVRHLAPGDRAQLGDYFAGLSAETRRRFGPHALDHATADALCAALDPARVLRIVALAREGGSEAVIAYVILMLSVTAAETERYARRGIVLDGATDCTLAPSVADAYQGQGLGSQVLRHVFRLARGLGRTRVVLLGGTQATNARAIHYYRKHGFEDCGGFEAPAGVWNIDMAADLGAAGEA